MEYKKYRWAKTYEAGESELIRFLDALNIKTDRWIAEEDETFEPHVHEKDKTVWCAEGSIQFKILQKSIPLQAGDALFIPALTMHEAVAGFAGCVCFESPLISDNPVISTAA